MGDACLCNTSSFMNRIFLVLIQATDCVSIYFLFLSYSTVHVQCLDNTDLYETIYIDGGHWEFQELPLTLVYHKILPASIIAINWQ